MTANASEQYDTPAQDRWRIDDLKEDVKEVKAALLRIEENMVSRGEFAPVRAVAYGLVGLMSVSLMGILVDAVVRATAR